MELNKLEADFNSSPGFLAAAKSKKSSQDATSETDDSMKEDTNDPPPFQFPPPPLILTESSGEQIKLKRSVNTKLKILVFIATLSLIVVVGFGAWTISIEYGKKAKTSDDSGCNGLEAKFEVSLQDLGVLRETVANLTRLLQVSLTSASDNVVDSTRNSKPKYTWA